MLVINTEGAEATMGYRLTATMVLSYLDYLIRHHSDDFKQIGFIGTGIRNVADAPYNKGV